jgi:large conductance mechanosensitive channel
MRLKEHSGPAPARGRESQSWRRWGASSNCAGVRKNNLNGGTMLKEFKDFAMKGNVVDLAIGVIIGAAFGKIVESMVGDIIMPLIGLLGNFDFSNLYLAIGKIPDNTSYVEAKKLGAAIGYGQFLTYVVNFIIIAWVLFLVVKGMNNLKKAEAAAVSAEPAAVPADVALLGEIRDLLAAKK